MLSLASVAGITFCGISFLLIIFIVIRTLAFGDPVPGWPSLVCILFFVSGIQLFCTGIVGQYLSKTYLETKHRPLYILKESHEQKEDATYLETKHRPLYILKESHEQKEDANEKNRKN